MGKRANKSLTETEWTDFSFSRTGGFSSKYTTPAASITKHHIALFKTDFSFGDLISVAFNGSGKPAILHDKDSTKKLTRGNKNGPPLLNSKQLLTHLAGMGMTAGKRYNLEAVTIGNRKGWVFTDEITA